MFTYQDQYQLAQQITQDFSAGALTMFKRDINDGGAMFLNRLGRKFNIESINANLVATQQYYQLPYDVLRPSTIRVKNGTFWYTPQLITSEEEWNELNAITTTGNYPLYWYVKGFNEIGLYPVPGSDVTNGLIVSYTPQHLALSSDDFKTGTISVANGDTSVTHSATGFTKSLVGQWLQVTGDVRWYRIGALVSTSEITLENFYEGDTNATAGFRIGQVMKIPEAYQDAPVYYACEKYYLTQNDQNTADSYNARFEQKVKSAKVTYGRSTYNAGVKKAPTNGRRPRWIDLTPPVSYP